ncbi:hypothetical protein BX666DRAFT_1970111 [Dichotomocladium elegans]|nr:hypothetical protein BX666DRAFT_1970111 [Dichotomocladium elegans]
MMPAGGAALRSTVTATTTERDEKQRPNSTESSAYVFAPNWMLPSGKKSGSKNLAFTSFAGGDDTAPSPSSRKIDHHRHHYLVSKPSSSSSSPYPGRAQQQQQQPLSTKPGSADRTRRLRSARAEEYKPEEETLTKDDFPTLVADDIVKQQDKSNHDNRSSAWNNPHMIKEKVLSPSFEDLAELEAPSPEDLEFERLKTLVPKQRQPVNAINNRKIGNRSSSSSSHQQRVRSKPILRSHNSNAKRETAGTTATTATPIAARTTATVAAAAAFDTATTVVKTSPAPNTSLSSSLGSVNKRMSSSSSSMSSSSAGMNETTLLYNDDVSSQTSTNFDLPRTPILANQEVAEKRVVTPLCVDEHEKEHFLSWFCTWTGRPGLEWKDDALSNQGFGEYSYFGPLGTKGGPSVLLHHESILMHPSWRS